MSISKVVFSFFVVQVICLAIPYAAYCQTESFDTMQYTPPRGWTRSTKEGVVIYTDLDKAANRFCILAIYAGTPSAGSPQKDFANKWNELIVKPFKADPSPETETKIDDGWTVLAGGAQIESDGVTSIVIMTVFSGFGKVVPVYAMFNDKSYIPQLDVFTTSIKLDKTVAPKRVATGSDYLDFDPFPDLPNHDPQKPLMGPLKKSVTMADLVGEWQHGGASVESYFNSSSGNYAGTNTTFYAEAYTIRSNGTFEHRFSGRTNNTTVREKDGGTVTLSGGFIILDYNGRITYKYQLIAFMPDPKGGAVLSLIEIGKDEPGLDPDRLRINCGHPGGYVSCAGGEDWVRRPAN